jgi:excisionase family DNA binding protein
MNTNTGVIEPLSYTVRTACQVSGMGRTRLYELIASGTIRAMKSGRRTLICAASLRSFVASLPELRSR